MLWWRPLQCSLQKHFQQVGTHIALAAEEKNNSSALQKQNFLPDKLNSRKLLQWCCGPREKWIPRRQKCRCSEDALNIEFGETGWCTACPDIYINITSSLFVVRAFIRFCRHSIRLNTCVDYKVTLWRSEFSPSAKNASRRRGVDRKVALGDVIASRK